MKQPPPLPPKKAPADAELTRLREELARAKAELAASNAIMERLSQAFRYLAKQLG